jgi:outer membrane lipoprotein-sorting protein
MGDAIPDPRRSLLGPCTRCAAATFAIAVALLGSVDAESEIDEPLPSASDGRAAEIVDRVDQIMRGNSSIGSMTMEIQAEHWKRSLETRVWSLGTERALILILKPTKEAGTSTLKAEDNIWNYLPKVERVIKVPTSMMMGSWMGSHFTNDDLVKESRMIRDYDIFISHEGEREGVSVWEFSLTPRPEAAVVWGKITLEVRQKDLMPTWEKFYDEDGELVRVLTFSDYREMDGRLIPTTMEMRPTDKQGEFTRVLYDDLRFDVPLEEEFFSLRRLRSLRPDQE